MPPSFLHPDFLLTHIADTMRFYHPRCIDHSGGFFHFFKDDGAVYDRETRHLVSSTRFVFNYAMAHRYFPNDEYADAMHHGLAFLRQVHRDPFTGGYAWQLRWDGERKTVQDADNHCYGLAFVLLAYSHALAAGVVEARGWMAETYELMERYFWEPAHGLYADQASADWTTLLPYRGQNANMHACEALISAWEASGERHYLRRAETLARNITVRQAGLADGRIWEHYGADWQVDWNYNRDDKTNIFRPWGYQPGHFTEWAKLLLILERHGAQLAEPAGWLLPRAIALFDDALENSWDKQHGGMAYGFAPDNAVCDGDKYFWVQAESIAAAAVLAVRTGERRFWTWYERLWDYSWTHMIDHRHGAWYRILAPDNRQLSDEKSPAGKTDYHTMGACYEVLRVLGRTA
jgi:mannose/cellobiose epimerase-like protein (N-acyl-D-glucosamine 2-epimerase family)